MSRPSDPRRSHRAATDLCAIALFAGVVLLAGCTSSKYRFDDGRVRPLAEQCNKARPALTDLVTGIQPDKAGAVLTPLAPDEVLQNDVQTLVATRGDRQARQSTEALQAAEDIRQWINLACPPVTSGLVTPASR